MNVRLLDKNDKAALEQLIYTIENALPVPEWWIPIDDIERSHFFDADWTCFLGAFNDDNELVAASALFFNEHEFAEEAEKLGLDIRSTNVAEVGRCMVHPDFRGHNLMCELNKRLCSIARNRGIDTILAVAHPDNIASNSSFRRLGAELKATATVFGSYQRNMCIFCRGRWWQPIGSGCRARQAVPEEDSLPCPIFLFTYIAVALAHVTCLQPPTILP